MLESGDIDEPDAAAIEHIYRGAPHGAMVVAGIATAIVFFIWFGFYLFIFIPRGFLS